jgi:hypothetical protein
VHASSAAEPAPVGVVITNRNRCATLRACLAALSAQSRPPRWVAIADLGSDAAHAACLEQMAGEHAVSYLRIPHSGPWVKGVAFNSAIVRMPPAPFVLQLDADVVVHPFLLELATSALARVDGLAFVASYAQAPVDAYDGTLPAFGELLAAARWGTPWGFGGSYLLPRDWLLQHGGMDESYVGWGFADSDLWLRAEQCIRTYWETSGSFAVHQPHTRQTGASTFGGNPNWERFRHQRGSATRVNPNGFGAAPLTRAIVRPGIRRARPVAQPVLRRAVRAMRQGRLTESVPAPAEGPASARGARGPGTGRSAVRPDPMTVSVVLVPGTAGSTGRATATAALQAQTLLPAEVVLARDGLPQALSRTDPGSTHLLVAGDDLVLRPDALAVLADVSGSSGRAVHGYRHEIPYAATDLGVLDDLPWEAWGATAFLLGRDRDRWLLAERHRLERHPADSVRALLGALAADPVVDLVRLGPTEVLGFRYPERPRHPALAGPAAA